MAKILVVDDDLKSRWLLVKVIEGLGHSVIQSANGKHAFNTLSYNTDIEVIITDVMMPEMNGKDFIKLVRGNDCFSDIPILIISAVVDEKDVKDVLAFNAVSFTAKPVTTEDIEEYIVDYLHEY